MIDIPELFWSNTIVMAQAKNIKAASTMYLLSIIKPHNAKFWYFIINYAIFIIPQSNYKVSAAIKFIPSILPIKLIIKLKNAVILRLDNPLS